jgi:hypothetical protein
MGKGQPPSLGPRPGSDPAQALQHPDRAGPTSIGSDASYCVTTSDTPGTWGGGDRGVSDAARGGETRVGLVGVKKLHESDPAAGYGKVYTHRVQDIGAGTEGGSELDRPPALAPSRREGE